MNLRDKLLNEILLSYEEPLFSWYKEQGGESLVISENDTYYIFLVADPTTSADTRSVRVQVSDATYVANTTGFDFTIPAGVQGKSLIEGDMKSLLKKD